MSTAAQNARASRASARSLKICLAASGGGHLRQLVDLENVWSRHEYFFVTEESALGLSLAERHPVKFVPHFGWGQAKLGKPLLMLRRALSNLIASVKIVLKERPDLLITTGAGAVFFTMILARLVGARVVAIESFARFSQPSLFGRMATPFAHEQVVQSERLRQFYPKAHVFDPLRILDKPAPLKDSLLFATVGATLPFDRLTAAVAGLKASGQIAEDVLIQTGVGSTPISGVTNHETLRFEEIQDLLKRASIVVSHGGTGSIITALREGCHVIVMPRLPQLGEVYDDHQVEITAAFELRGLIQSASDPDSLLRAIEATRQRQRVTATTEPQALAEFLDGIISSMGGAPAEAKAA